MSDANQNPTPAPVPDTKPAPPASPVNWKQVVAAVIAAALTALLHQIGVVPVCGAGKGGAVSLVSGPCACPKCETPDGPDVIEAGPFDPVNYGVDHKRLKAEAPSYGPGFRPAR